MAASTSPSSSAIGDVQQLQRWTQHADITFQEINTSLARLTALLSSIISLNNLKTK